MVDSRLGQGRLRGDVEHLVNLESKKMTEAYPKDVGGTWKGHPQAKSVITLMPK